MTWWDDALNYVKNSWSQGLPIAATPFTGPMALTPKELALGAVAVPAAALLGGGATALASKIPAVASWMSPTGTPPNAAYSTTTDRPRPSMFDTIAPGTRHRTVYGGYTRGKTVGAVLRETALKEGIKAAKARGRRKAARKPRAAKKSRRRSTRGDLPTGPGGFEVDDTRSKRRATRRRSTKAPTAKQLAARRRFAAMSRARAKARRAQ